ARCLYEALPPAPRWTFEVESPGRLHYRILAFLDDAIVFGDLSDYLISRPDIRLFVRDLRTGEERAGFWRSDGHQGYLLRDTSIWRSQWRNEAHSDGTEFVLCDGYLRGVSPRTGRVWDLRLPANAKYVEAALPSPDEDQLAAIVWETDEKLACLILDSLSGDV